jgi:transposase
MSFKVIQVIAHPKDEISIEKFEQLQKLSTILFNTLIDRDVAATQRNKIIIQQNLPGIKCEPRRLSKYDYEAFLKDFVNSNKEQFNPIHSHLVQDVAKRYSLAVKALDSKLKSNKPIKHPKRKEDKDFKSLYFKDIESGFKIDWIDNFVKINKTNHFSTFNFKLDNFSQGEIAKGKIKSLFVKKHKNHFSVGFVVEGNFNFNSNPNVLKKSLGQRLYKVLSKKQSELRDKRQDCRNHAKETFQNSKDKYSVAKQKVIKREASFAKQTIKYRDEKSIKMALSSKDPKFDVSISKDAVGIDFGCGYYNTIMLSNGETISLPSRLYLEQISLERMWSLYNSKKDKSSKRAISLREKISRKQDRITHIRAEFGHAVSKYLLSKFNEVYCEDLKSKQLVEDVDIKFIRKQVLNAAFGSIKEKLNYKAEIAGNLGKIFKLYDSHYTSQVCPHCLTLKKKKLSDRVHRCECGLEIDRDLASAILILKLLSSYCSHYNTGDLDKSFEQEFLRIVADATKSKKTS